MNKVVRCFFWNLLLLILAANIHAASFTDTLTSGINSNYWIIRTNTGLFSISTSSTGLSFSKGTGSVTNFQAALLALKLVAQGNFDVRVDFTNAAVAHTTGSIGNQIQLNTRFGGQDFLAVRSDEGAFGQNAHVFPNPPGNSGVGVNAWTASSGTLRVVRVGTLVQGYIDSTLLYQNNYNSNDAAFSIVLQNNQSSDATAVTYKNFQLTADNLVALAPLLNINTPTPTNLVLHWKDTSWPDTLAGYPVLSTTNLAGVTSWQQLTNSPTLISNQYFLPSGLSGSQKFFRLHQGSLDYH